MSTVKSIKRGDVVLLPIAFVSGAGSKVRPALIVQSDGLNSRLHSTIVAIITTTNKRAKREDCQLFIDLSSPEGKQSGLLYDSTIKCEHLDTVDQRDIVRVIGHLPDSTMRQVADCIRSSLDLP
jgi:mRNA interferase MazF